MWTDKPPQRPNFRAWMEIICNDLLPGDTNKERFAVVSIEAADYFCARIPTAEPHTCAGRDGAARVIASSTIQAVFTSGARAEIPCAPAIEAQQIWRLPVICATALPDQHRGHDKRRGARHRRDRLRFASRP